MRITTVLPVRSTPVASANTLGRPSNTNPTTPSGARRASTDQPSWSTPVDRVVAAQRRRRATTRRPAIMSPRIRVGQHEAGRRAAGGRRPRRRRRRWRRGSARTTASSARRGGEGVEERRDLVVACTPPRAANAVDGGVDGASAAATCSAAGTCSRSPVSWHDEQPVAGRERGRRARRRHVASPGRRRRRSAGRRRVGPASGRRPRRQRTGRPARYRAAPPSVACTAWPTTGCTSASSCRGATSPSATRSPRQMVNFVYAIGDRATGECVLVDPAYAVDDLVDAVEADGMTVGGVLATHYHPDHVGGSMMGYTIEGVTRAARAGRAARCTCRRDEAPWVARTTGIAESELAAHDAGDMVTVGDGRDRAACTRPATRRAASASSSTAGSSPATRCSSTAAGAPTCPGSDAEQMYDSLQRLAAPARRHDRLPRPPLLDAVERHDGGHPRAELRLPPPLARTSG